MNNSIFPIKVEESVWSALYHAKKTGKDVSCISWEWTKKAIQAKREANKIKNLPE